MPRPLWAQVIGNCLARALYVLQLVTLCAVVLRLWKQIADAVTAHEREAVLERRMAAVSGELVATRETMQGRLAALEQRMAALVADRQHMQARLDASQQQTTAATEERVAVTQEMEAQLAALRREAGAAGEEIVAVTQQMEARLAAVRSEAAAARVAVTQQMEARFAGLQREAAARARVGVRPPKEDNLVGYHPKRSLLTEATLAAFIRAPISGNLTEVPGIGQSSIGRGNNRVTTTHQLIEKFLALRSLDDGGREADSVEHCDKFWYWLKSQNVNSHRAGIVQAIAKKVNTWVPGVYDANRYA